MSSEDANHFLNEMAQVMRMMIVMRMAAMTDMMVIEEMVMKTMYM
jgi:hypothetical protein